MAKGSDHETRDRDLERRHEAYLRSVVTYPAPPKRFDPLKATARELQRYGFPRRPNAEKEGHLVPLWEKAFGRPHKRITAEIEIDRVLLDRSRRRRLMPRDGRFAPGGWGGIVAYISDFPFSPAEPANMVYGEWMVPTMAPDYDNPKTPMTVGFWVGLDGAINTQVLQAGTAATVTGETIDYWAWFEWYPSPPVRITNFPIAAGDLVTVLVCAPAVGHGFASMLNRTTGLTTSVGFDPPAGVSSMGASAEWIVEGISDDLPNFVLAGFHKCVAGTKTHRIDLTHPTEAEISGTSGDLTVAVAWLPETVLVLWEGFQ